MTSASARAQKARKPLFRQARSPFTFHEIRRIGVFLRCFSSAYHNFCRGTTKTSGEAGGFCVFVVFGHLWGRVIPTRSRQAYSKQVCLWDLAQIICIAFIIQVAWAI